MVKKQQSKRQRNIKSKLMAAICMLLVSTIMMVSSTYAWFTLSTAPEVTGITTAVGANGNLEMALVPLDGDLEKIGSAAGDSMAAQDATLANLTWGNLVDLESETYGLKEIVLYPSALNVTQAGLLDASLLKTPEYGADGRVSELVARTVTSTFVNNSFPQNNSYGVRAVGNASGMTDRQLAHRSARSAASTSMVLAKNQASNSLETNGAALANIAVTHAANNAATHTQEDVAALLAITNDLLGTTGENAKTGVLQHIENAYIQYIIGYGASQEGVDAGMDDTEYKAFESAVESATTLSAVQAELATYGVTLPEEVTAPATKLATTKEKVQNAQTQLQALVGDNDAIAWGSISPALTLLADVDAMKVNDIPATEIKTDAGINHLISTIGGGLNVSMASGGGVYADVADHCGDFNASIVIKKLTYGNITVNDINARMKTASTVVPPYLTVLGNAVETAGSPASGEGAQVMPISEFYGYIIDLAFRTNAAESDLQLQVDGIDRIYKDNTGNDETMGAGSTMTFASAANDFSDEQVKSLMECIRIIFFDKGTSTILAKAKLDMTNPQKSADGYTADIRLYTEAGGTVSTTTYESATYVADSGLTYYTKTTTPAQDNYTEVTDLTGYTTVDGLYTYDGTTYTAASGAPVDGTTYFTKTTTPAKDNYTAVDDATAAAAAAGTLYVAKTTTDTATTETITNEVKITSLTQNQPTSVSVLVYLDGNSIENADVAAGGTQSMTGTMNLQFSSTANLVPMEYAALGGNNTTTEQQPENGGEVTP